MAVMDERTRGLTRQLSERIWVNGIGQPGPASVLGPVGQSLQERRVLNLAYCDASEQLTSRRVDPQLLGWTAGHWYLIAYCRLREQVRWFRLDRIQHAALTAETANDLPLDAIGQPPPTAHPVDPFS